MLSRVAESLYWMARYIERAEDITRLVSVNFNALLDAPEGAGRHGWAAVLRAADASALYESHYAEPTAKGVIEFLLWHPENPSAVTACITRARENARSVREQISSEMWEQINRLYFRIRSASHQAALTNPGELFRTIRDGAQAFQGVALATMTHGEAYQFIHLGLNIERADKTARILNGESADMARQGHDGPRGALQLISVLRACGALEPFRRTPGMSLSSEAVVEYLLLNGEFPRSVLFCLRRSAIAIERIAGPGAEARAGSPRRSLGRLIADLEYLDLPEVLNSPAGGEGFFANLLWHLNVVGDDIARCYFNTRIILPEDRPRHQPPHQQQQQQQ